MKKRMKRPISLSSLAVEFDREADGRWIAEVQELPGVICYGANREDALAKAEALALRVVADQLEIGEKLSIPTSVAFSLAWAIGQPQKVSEFLPPYSGSVGRLNAVVDLIS